MRSVIVDAVNQLDPQLQSRVSVGIEPNNLQVKAHVPVLRQVISNLINNGLKFTKPGKLPTVAVKAFRVGESVRIQVEDQGIGIAPQHRDRAVHAQERLE